MLKNSALHVFQYTIVYEPDMASICHTFCIRHHHMFVETPKDVSSLYDVDIRHNVHSKLYDQLKL